MGIELLLHRTITQTSGAVEGNDRIHFVCEDGAEFVMQHVSECCESVQLEEVIGDMKDLLRSPILRAECVTNNDDPPSEWTDSHTWTFYKLATIKGEVVLRWLGESNGYYSEEVTFSMTKATDADRMAHHLGAINIPEDLL